MVIQSLSVDFYHETPDTQQFLNYLQDLQQCRKNHIISSSEYFINVFFTQSCLWRRSISPQLKVDLTQALPIIEIGHLNLTDPDFQWKQKIDILAPAQGLSFLYKTFDKTIYPVTLMQALVCKSLENLSYLDTSSICKKENDLFYKDKKFFGAEVLETENGYYMNAVLFLNFSAEKSNMALTARSLYTRHTYTYTGLAEEYPKLTKDYLSQYLLSNIKNNYDSN